MKRHPARAFLASLSIQQVLLLLLVCGIILPVILFALGLAHVTNQSLQETQEAFARQTVQNNAQQLEHTIASISYAAAYITSDSEMQRNAAAIAHDAASPEAVFGKEDIIRFIRSVASANLYTLDPEPGNTASGWRIRARCSTPFPMGRTQSGMFRGNRPPVPIWTAIGPSESLGSWWGSCIFTYPVRSFGASFPTIRCSNTGRRSTMGTP